MLMIHKVIDVLQIANMIRHLLKNYLKVSIGTML